MKWTMLTVAGLAVWLGGCQSDVVSPLVPLPLPVKLAPSTKLTVVGTGETPEVAREAAIQHMVHQVILPPTEPEDAPTSEFVESLIRGYNVASVAQDFLGKYYVTVELTIYQLGINFQELYHASQLQKKELEAYKKESESEEELRRLADERAERAKKKLDESRKDYEKRMLELRHEIERLKAQAKPAD